MSLFILLGLGVFVVLCPINLVVGQLTSFATQDTDYKGLVDNIEKAVALVFSTLVVICIVIAGILFLTSSGDPNKVEKARNALIWGVVGVVIGIVAYSILGVINSMLS